MTNIDLLGLDYCKGSDGAVIADADGGDNDFNCANAGGKWVTEPNYVVDTQSDVSQSPSAIDNAEFFALWASGDGPQEIDYGANDGLTLQLASSVTFDSVRQAYVKQGCPNTGSPIGGGNHFLPFFEGYGNGNTTLQQVGGFSAYGSTNGNATTFTVVNVAGQASFSGATTIGSVGATALPFVVGLFDSRAGLVVSLLSVNGVKDNPYGATGPFHSITQKFSWTESDLCKKQG
jgi:hypothetical protein